MTSDRDQPLLRKTCELSVPALEILLEIFLGEKCKELTEKEVLLLPEEAKAELQGTISYL